MIPAPVFRFSRVDGGVWGARGGLGSPRGMGRVAGEAAYASGPNEWLGSARFVKRVPTARALWSLDLGWEKATSRMGGEHAGTAFNWARALLNGSDRTHYLRQEGARLELRRESEGSTLVAGYRDQREDSLPVRALWTLTGREPVVTFNLPAKPGRVRAFAYGAGVGLGDRPPQLWVEHETSSRRVESDFDYRRWRAISGATVPLASWAALATQLKYGRLSGDLVPQAAFFLGGSHSLRSLPGSSAVGTRTAFARSELALAPDLLALAGVPHPALLELQGSAFAATGAVWGRDPFTGAELDSSEWPDRRLWRSEVGVGMLYRPVCPIR